MSRTSRTVKKGDLVRHREHAGRPNGIVIEARKKERSTHKSKHVIEIVIGQVADVLWDTGIVETDVRIEDLDVVHRAK